MMTSISTLKSMENGSIGEARTKELLIDRFWILERSVDVQGADFIIQRKLLERNLLDKTPPKFGIVQAKFIQNGNTSIYIDKDYVINPNDNSIRKEFFLFVHTGIEDKKEVFFLTGEDIVNKYKETTSGNKTKYYIPGNTILSDNSVKVNSISWVNDRIENLLLKSDFIKNRLFVNWYSYGDVEIDINNIDYDYTIDIGTNYDPIPQMIYNYKIAARDLLKNIKEFGYYLNEIIEETNVENIIDHLDYISSDMCNSGSGTSYIKFYSNRLYLNEDARNSFEKFKCSFEKLKNNNKIQVFVALKKQLKNILIREFNNHKKEFSYNDKQNCLLPIKNSELLFNITYDVNTEKFNITSTYDQFNGKLIDSEFVIVKQEKNNNQIETKINLKWRYWTNINSANTLEENINQLFNLFSSDIDDYLINMLII